MNKLDEESFKKLQLQLLSKRHKKRAETLLKDAKDRKRRSGLYLFVFLLSVSTVVVYLISKSMGSIIDLNPLTVFVLLISSLISLPFIWIVFATYNSLKDDYDQETDLKRYIETYNRGSEDLASYLNLLD